MTSIYLSMSSTLSTGQTFFSRLETFHTNLHSEKASEKNSHPWGGCKLAHSSGGMVPGSVSYLTLIYDQKLLCLISGHKSGFSHNTVSSSGALPPPTHSVFVLPPNKGMKHTVALPMRLWRRKTGTILPSFSLFLFLFLLVSVTQGFSLFTLTAPSFCISLSHTHRIQPALSKNSPGWHIALFSGLLRAWLHALFIPQADSFHQRRKN